MIAAAEFRWWYPLVGLLIGGGGLIGLLALFVWLGGGD